MWEFVAAAAAGLNAGAGLQAALAGAPAAATDSVAFTSFAGRTRMLSLLLSTVATAGCVNAYYAESQGALWLAAAAGVGVGIPFSLLLMAPPKAVMSGGRLDSFGSSSPRVQFADEMQPVAAPPAGETAPATAGAAGEAWSSSAFAAQAGDGGMALPVETAGGGGGGRRRRLMYSKSGVLVSPTDFATAWSKKFWFSATLNTTAFACMMLLLSTGKDAASYGMAPF